MSDRKLGRSGGDCADSVTVNLSEPLGSRRVVDDSSRRGGPGARARVAARAAGVGRIVLSGPV